MADIYFRLNKFNESNLTAIEWLKLYPEHPLIGVIFFIIGRNFKAMGNIPNSFQWWVRAEESESEKYDPGDDGKDIRFKINGLIDGASTDELIRMTGFSKGKYLPEIYHRAALISLKDLKFKDAKQYAMALIRSTPEQEWVSKGRHILENASKALGEDLEPFVKEGVIGCLLPLSGDLAPYGQELLNGIQLGMGMFSGNEEGYKLELVIRDTAGSPEKAVSGVEDLVVNEKAVAIIGPMTSKPATAAAEKAQELGVPIITLTQKSGITDIGDMVFRNFLTPEKEVEAILNEAMGKRGFVRFGVLYPENSYGRFFMNLFWDRLEEMGGRITAIESYDPSETDYASQIKKMTGLYYDRPESITRMLDKIKGIKSNEEPAYDASETIIDFDAVFIPDNYQRVALIAPQFPFHNVFNVPFLGTSLWWSPELIKMTGDYVQNAIFPTGFFPERSSPEVQSFVNDYKTIFSSDPGVLAATGYDTVRFLKGLIEKSDIRTKDDFLKGLSQYSLPDGVTGTISFNENGEVEKMPDLLTVIGKKIQLVQEHDEDYY
jgi:ABC-type branched-subunit amino acid transport system substrate-binding protein